MRLRDLWADPPGLLTHRELIQLISCLPAEAVTPQLVLERDTPWSPERHLLTDIADLLHGANWQRSAKPGSHAPRSRYRRPRPPRDDRDDHEDQDDQPAGDEPDVEPTDEARDEGQDEPADEGRDEADG